MIETAINSKLLMKLHVDEPIFVLRGQDRSAPGAIRDWAHRAKGMGMSQEKFDDAMDCAVEMEKWQQTHVTKVPD